MNICFIGGGNMASAIIGGLLEAESVQPENLRVVEINADSRARLQDEFGVVATEEFAHGVEGSEIVVLAVKPQQLREVAAQLSPLLKGQLVVSIAAGVRAADLGRWLNSRNVVRAMPNTPALIRKGVTGLYALKGVCLGHKAIANKILDAIGKSIWLDDETQMDALTAISGSGPAYVFYFIEAMQQAAQELGLAESKAQELVYETFAGAAELAKTSTDDVSVLRARVTSKNGTTERALLSMESNQVKQHIIKAVKAAAVRSRELGDELGGA
jgi:pyrroline-5-carboxylate reductase